MFGKGINHLEKSMMASKPKGRFDDLAGSIDPAEEEKMDRAIEKSCERIDEC